MSEVATVNTEGAHAIARRMAKTLELKNAIANLTTQRDDEKKRADKAEKALTDYQAKQDASPLAKQNADLKQKLRDVQHRKTFDKLAAERGVTNEKALDDLYEKSGWKADADEFDPDEMGAAIDAQKEERPYLFTAVKADANGMPVKPAPARGQGSHGSRKTSVDPDIIEDDDPRLNDAGWMMLNQAKMVASAKAKIARGDLEPGNLKAVPISIDGLSTR